MNDESEAWRYPPTPSRTPAYCTHGAYPCTGNPNGGLPPCAADEHHYCAHGFDRRQTTRDREPVCPYCRGVTAHRANPATYSPRLTRRTPA